MAIRFFQPIEVTPDTYNSWQDVDLSAYVPSTATGVILHFYNSNPSTYPRMGWRKNGSSDNRFNSVTGHFGTAVGIDGSGICELKIEDDRGHVYLIGYLESEAAFFVNSPDKSLVATSTWTDIDISGDTGEDTAIGAFFEAFVDSVGHNYSLRKNGSTDDRTGLSLYRIGATTIGVDGSEICEGYIDHIDMDFFLNGYIKTKAVFNTNATDVSIGTIDTWLDLATLPDNSPVGGIYEITTLDAYNDTYGLRANGSSETLITKTCPRNAWNIVACDSSRLIEGYINDLDTKFYLTGYLQGVFPKTFTADAVLKGAVTKTFTANARVGISTYTKTFSADALIAGTKFFTADAILQKTSTKTLTADAFLFKTSIVSPTGGSSEESPVYLRFTTCSLPIGVKRHFLLEVDKTSSAFGDLELDLDSYTSQTNWEYWDGDSWEALTAAGLDPAYYGNDVRYQATLTDGDKWWRVREKMRRDS